MKTRNVTYFKDFKTKHKVYVALALMAILLTGNIVFLNYGDAHPDQEVRAGVNVFILTCSLMGLVMALLVKRFQKEYDQPTPNR